MDWFTYFQACLTLKQIKSQGLFSMAKLYVGAWEIEYKYPERDIFFIYGTLKTGHRNHDLLIPAYAKLISDNAIAEHLALIEVFNGTPAAIPKPGRAVGGEVWELTKTNIKIVDWLEQGFIKSTVVVRFGDTKQYCTAYLWPEAHVEIPLPINIWTVDIERRSLGKGILC